jgi:hypothetical protein
MRTKLKLEVGTEPKSLILDLDLNLEMRDVS